MCLRCAGVGGGQQTLGKCVQNGKRRLKRLGRGQVGAPDRPGERAFMSKCSLSHGMSCVPTCTCVHDRIMAF